MNPNQRLVEMYKEATRRKIILGFPLFILASLAYCFTLIWLTEQAPENLELFVIALGLYLAALAVFAIWLFFNDTYFDISESLKNRSKD
tara:strand:+ start:2306 stop:2572 length:267 start_codon:yes stop_codon:yes gene_type:complete